MCCRSRIFGNEVEKQSPIKRGRIWKWMGILMFVRNNGGGIHSRRVSTIRMLMQNGNWRSPAKYIMIHCLLFKFCTNTIADTVCSRRNQFGFYFLILRLFCHVIFSNTHTNGRRRRSRVRYRPSDSNCQNEISFGLLLDGARWCLLIRFFILLILSSYWKAKLSWHKRRKCFIQYNLTRAFSTRPRQ